MPSGARMVSDRDKPMIDQHELDDTLGYVSDDARKRTAPTGARVRFERSRPSRAKQLIARLRRIKTDLDSGAGNRKGHSVAKRIHLRLLLTPGFDP